MTTIDTAAAWRVVKPFTLVAMATILGLGLAGCETGSNLFGLNNNTATPALSQAGPTGQQTSAAKITIAPVIGAPDSVAKQLQAQLSSEIEAKNVSVAKAPGTATDYTIRGYIVSAKESAGTKVSYIWDVIDTQGKRVNRITGEELLKSAPGTDPWAAVTPTVVSSIAGKTASSLATWLPTQQTARATSSAVGAPSPALVASSPTTPAVVAQPRAPLSTSAPTQVATNTTGSVTKSNKLMAMVPSVTGAPGDGGVSLTNALQRELTRKGVALSTTPGQRTYVVAGTVVVGQGSKGKQPIQIDWDVKDPSGKKLGTVSQKNEIPQGSLDGAWGKTADAAAAAAAQGILKLLPKVN